MGTSVKDFSKPLVYRDHPHAYGDKYSPDAFSRLVDGSSPRVWGQVSKVVLLLPSRRIIPTRMGTRVVFHVCYKTIGDHPHAYGDKFVYRSLVLYHKGSSPRVWGQASRIFQNLLFIGIIPTRMGTSEIDIIGTEQIEDHPHAYGDKLKFL